MNGLKILINSKTIQTALILHWWGWSSNENWLYWFDRMKVNFGV